MKLHSTRFEIAEDNAEAIIDTERNNSIVCEVFTPGIYLEMICKALNYWDYLRKEMDKFKVKKVQGE